MARYKGHFESRKPQPSAEISASDPENTAHTANDAQALQPVDPAQKPPKRRRGPVIALIVLIVLAVSMGSLALSVALRGKAMRKSPSVPYIPQQVQPTQEERAPSTPVKTELEGDTLIYNGKRYRYNSDVVTFLLLGVDRENPDAYPAGDCNVMAFSDVVMLAAMDYRNNKISFFTLSRDTMCQFTKLAPDGSVRDTATGQLAIPFSYGDGHLKSLELTKNTVSELFGSLPIYSCSALYLEGLSALNNAIGGVTLTPIETVQYGQIHLEAGESVTLDADQAEAYIRFREHTVDGNLIRMERQKHYFKALVTQLLRACRKDLGTALRVYRAIQKDVVTDLDLNDILYLAATAAGMQVSGDVASAPGTVTLSEDNYAEFYLDEEGCFELLLGIYYEELSGE